MSRPERLHVPGGRYFVIDEFRASEVLVAAPNRPHGDAELRAIAARRARYEVQLAYATARWCARVHAHCWLPGCALLEVQIGRAPLEHVMHSLRGGFSRYFRRSTGLAEPVYAHRYHAWLVEPDCTLDLRRDICWRPVRAGLCKHPTEYPYTTIHYALDGSPPAFLARSHLLAWFEQRQHHPRAQLLSFLAAPPNPEFAALLSGSRQDRRIIGHPNFVRKTHRQERRPRLAAPPEAIIGWARLLVASRASASPEDPMKSMRDLVAAVTAWSVSRIGIGSVSTVATWFHPRDRSHLERAIDHYMQARPDLFSDCTLRQLVRHLCSLADERPDTQSQTACATDARGQ